MIFLLLILFQLKHFIADFLLQNEYMLKKFNNEGWKLPLAAHCAVHSAFTLSTSLIVSNYNILISIGLTCLDFIVHFIMDRVKASPNLLGRYQSINKDDVEFYKTKFKFIDNEKKNVVEFIMYTGLK